MKFFIDPRIGRRKVRDIKRSDIAELHHELRETPYQANRDAGSAVQNVFPGGGMGVFDGTAPTPAFTSSATRRKSVSAS